MLAMMKTTLKNSVSPGPGKKKNAVAMQPTAMKNAQNFFLALALSEIAPSIGEPTATMSIAMVVMMPQTAVALLPPLYITCEK